jgi:hypothetical protein
LTDCLQGAFSSGGGGGGQSVSTAQTILSSGGHLTTTATALEDAAGITLTLPDTGGTLDCLCNQFLSCTVNSTGESLRFALVQNTTALTYVTADPLTDGSYSVAALSCLCDGNGETLKLQWSTAGANTGTIRVTAGWATPTISAFAVG